MDFEQFRCTLDDAHCPAGLSPCLQALWHDAAGDWESAHRIVQAENGRMAARIHAYLHRKEGDLGNAGYWQRRAGSQLDESLTLEQEWQQLAQQASREE